MVFENTQYLFKKSCLALHLAKHATPLKHAGAYNKSGKYLWNVNKPECARKNNWCCFTHAI